MTGAPGHSMPPLDGAHVSEAHQALLRDKSIQFDLVPAPEFKPPLWLKAFAEFLASPIAHIMFWTIAGVLVLLLVAFLLHRLLGLQLPWRRKEHEAAEESSWQPEAGPARALLREADALASDGRFDEAAHLLLFRSIEDIDSRRPKLVRPALTSRDIAGAPDIPSPARTAFEAIVMMVEHSLFGGRRLGESDWLQCRAAYERFAFAEAWR